MKKKRIAHSLMKTKHTTQPVRHSFGEGGFFNPRTLIALLLCAAAACSMLAGTLLAFFRPEAPSNVTQGTLTFAARVAYQRAIEEVYWRHRIWPKERPDPKPPLNAVMTHAQLEKKVTDYLRKSRALEDYWQRPITAERLQVEMNRMAKHTKQPEVLRELFAALGNDPLVVAECLARPILAERLFTSAMAYRDVSWAATQRTRSRKADRLFPGYILPTIATASNAGGTCNDAWGATSTINAPSARDLHTAVWTGSEMIVWGGTNFSNYLKTGGRYNPGTDSWTATSTTNAPSARDRHTAVWTGSEMIVWGGTGDSTGGKYNPMLDRWTATSTTNAPSGRSGHAAVWTSNEMIIWGGSISGPTYFNTGGRYNPGTDSWTATNTTNAPTGRASHTAGCSANEMIIWGGGISGPTNFNTGGRYDPGTDSWTATSTSNAPAARVGHTAVWTSSEMVVWGGIDNSPAGLTNTGGRYCGQYPTPTPTPTASPTPTPSATPTVITVTNTNDSGPGSLRQALADANYGDTIEFAVTGTIGLTSGELLVNQDTTISGPGSENLAVNGNDNSRVFHIGSGRTVTISGLTITNGHADHGGGIFNDHARLTLINCAIDGNYAADRGSGIYNDGDAGLFASLEIDNSSVRGNSGTTAIYNDANFNGHAALVITNSTLSDNVGDAIRSNACGSPHGGSPQVQITSTTISGNSGGALFNDCLSNAGISNSTISGNAAGVHNIWSMGIGNSTFSSTSGINIYNETVFGQPASIVIGSTVLNASPSQPNIFNNGIISSNGYNILNDDGGGYFNGPGDQINTDPMLGPLQDNGGPTLTHALLPGSPAIDAGNPNFTPP